MFLLFWRQHPALLYGLGMLLGCRAALTPSPLLFIPLVLLVLPLLWTLRLRLLFTGLLALATFFYVGQSYRFATLPEQGLEGSAVVKISSVSHAHHPFAIPGSTAALSRPSLLTMPHCIRSAFFPTHH